MIGLRHPPGTAVLEFKARRSEGTTPPLPFPSSRLTVGQLEETETNDAVFVWPRREWQPGPEAVGLVVGGAKGSYDKVIGQRRGPRDAGLP